jgi:hypothetical protein
MQAQKRARHRPDLRLAETYLPAAICLAKCVLLYCFVGPVLAGIAHAGTRLLVVTALLLCLYFDHLYPSAMGQQRFVDTNALCVDVVAGTLLSHMLGLDALGLHNSIAAANALAAAQKASAPQLADALLKRARAEFPSAPVLAPAASLPAND